MSDSENGYPTWWNKLIQKPQLKKAGLKAGYVAGVAPNLFNIYMNHLSKTVVHDETTKALVFLTGLSAFTQNPINLFLKGESSIGKTYNVVQTLKYFPSEDVLMLGALSPTALVHDYGVLVDSGGNPIDLGEKPSSYKPKKNKSESEEGYQERVDQWKEEHRRWNELMQEARYIVDLSNKILVFLESPSTETYNRLRPILSHDKEEISYKFTDKRGGKLRTTHVVIRGWCTTIFLTTVEDYIEDLATRSLTVTPETHEQKFKDAIKLQGQQRAFPWLYENEDTEWVLLHGYIGFLKNHIKDFGVVNPYARELAEAFPSTVGRYMRDFNHVEALIETCALFHAFQRPVLCNGEKQYVMCGLDDLALVFGILPEIEETTVTGLPRHILDCYHKVMEPLYTDEVPFNYETLTNKYNEIFHRKRSSGTLRQYVFLLRQVGLADTMPDPSDKRKHLIKLIAKNNGDTFVSVVKEFSDSFTLERFKSWFDEAKNSVGKNEVFTKGRYSDDDKANIEDLYEQYYHTKILLKVKERFPQRNFEGGSKLLEDAKQENNGEESLTTQSNVISPKRNIDSYFKNNTTKPTPLVSPSTPLVELEPKLHDLFTEKQRLTTDEVVDFVVQQGYTRKEAEAYHERSFGTLYFMDAEGYVRWA